jgi:hypothetical protein
VTCLQLETNDEGASAAAAEDSMDEDEGEGLVEDSSEEEQKEKVTTPLKPVTKR